MQKNKLKNFIACVFFIIVGIVSGYTAAIYSESDEVIVDENVSSQEVIENNEKYDYLIKTFEGKIAVFTQNSKKPEIVFEVYTHQLPEYDRFQLEKGIVVEDYSTLLQLIEDYTT
ncbi:MAG: hypothetical protein RSD67_02290 [Oscillospiraceae bacterium]